MAEDKDNGVDELQEAGEELLDSGSYEVIRTRLSALGRELAAKADALNTNRKEVFGGTELALTATVRVRTEHNCVPRDIANVSGMLLFGYNVFLGLKSETAVSDVFSIHACELADGELKITPLAADAHGGFLGDQRFAKEFHDLYRYFRDTRLMQLRATDTRLLAVFRVGHAADDVKVFRWEIAADGTLTYLDNRGDRDNVLPPAHDFEWTVTTRDDHVAGRHPHVSILDQVFVETVGGDLTVKVEDNTEDGLGIYREPVEDADQSLDDAAIAFARLGRLILMRVLPFRELEYRYLVFNTRTRGVWRVDAIGHSCVQLPEDHGVVFPGGYCLATGELKTFKGAAEGLVLERAVRSPNGEDILYVFHQREHGYYLLLAYNMIRKEMANPVRCSGYTHFTDGTMLVFRQESEEPTRVHPMQVWQTPFVSLEYAAEAPTDDSFLTKVGNADLVRGISDAYSVVRLADNQEPTRETYEDLIAATRALVDSHYWLGHQDVGDVKATLEAVLTTSELIIDEFEKVIAIRERADEALVQAAQDQEQLIQSLHPEEWDTVDAYMKALTALRNQRGHLISLREVRAIDRERLDALEAGVVEHFDRTSRACVEFLLDEAALAPLTGELDEVLAVVEEAETVAALTPLGERLEALSEGLTVLSDVVGGLQVGDATERTVILERISEVFGHLNRVRATYAARRQTLLSREGRAEFSAQFNLFGQTAANALSLADSPERCDEQLSYLMVQLEELESRFSELDEFLGDLAAKREEVYESFSTRKQTLLDERQRRAGNLFAAAERIFAGIDRRAKTFASADELNAYFASDAMVMKVRDLTESLLELGDSVRADELVARLKTARQEALRGLRDRLDLYEEGATVIKLGRHRFSVNTQPLELTMVPRGDAMALYVTGTDFHEVVDDAEFAATQPFWDQDLVSETAKVYRGEFLAASILEAAELGQGAHAVDDLQEARLRDGGLLEITHRAAVERYDEGYERGVHDADAAAILDQVLALRATAGLLRMAPAPRAYACLYWALMIDDEQRELLRTRALSLGRLREAFATSPALEALAADMTMGIATFLAAEGIDCPEADARIAGRYLVEELIDDEGRFATSAEAIELRRVFFEALEAGGRRVAFEKDLEALSRRLGERFRLVRAWFEAFVSASDDERVASLAPVLEEAVAVVVTERRLERFGSGAMSTVEISGLLGRHPRIVDRTMTLRLDEFLARTGEFMHTRVPAYRAYRELRHSVIERGRERLRLEEFASRVLTSFVRNRLINDVYLPLIGDNLAKQLGAVGEGKRTDLMGLLLLISPPGYGKTTLMEYVASRIGLAFVKVNGPSLGHAVTSLDPAEAPNATARQEVEKTNFAFEMGNNVMLYLDDIQHTNPELLQKFISLCDAQRRVEGVWQGRTRTYDLRGKKFCVVMAGNPYTESGEKFQIPDMLANRADTYNLGDILEGKDELFALSYLENSITSNPTLAPLATREMEDVYRFVGMARGEEVPTTDLEHGYSAVEVADIVATIRHLFHVQQLLLAVNQMYIQSAAMEDAYRTEPPFALQGSYRNMNKLAEKVVPAMNRDELEALIDDHYVSEAQTLTTGAEHNLLKLAELRERVSPEQAERWQHIKSEFGRQRLLGGADDDPSVRVSGVLSGLGDQLEGIRGTIAAAADEAREGAAARAEAAAAARTAAVEGGTGWERLSEHLATLEASLEKLSRPELEVRVEQQAPAGVDGMLASQVELLENTLVPLAKLMTENVWDARKLDDRLVEILNRVKDMESKLRGETGKTHRTAVAKKTTAAAKAPAARKPPAKKPPTPAKRTKTSTARRKSDKDEG